MAVAVGIRAILKNYFRAVAACVLTAVGAGAYAVQPTNGYFTGIELQPLGNASITTVETEPAVALVFAADQNTADITRQFDEWYESAARPDINVFAIGVDPANLSDDVLLEAINQRDLSMPVFLSSADLLLGDDFRLLVLNDDRAVERLSSLEASVLNAAIERLGIEVPAATPAVVTTEPETTVTVQTDSGTLPSGTSYSSVTTTTEMEVTESSRVVKGTASDNIYVNESYGFSVEFPPGWDYQVAAREDGAVAVEPRGSEMDMRVWAVPAGDISEAQAYIDQRLEVLARNNSTRVNVERRFNVHDEGQTGIDVTYNYTRPLDPESPARGALLYRGRIQVFVDNGYVKAAGVQAPSGEFMATFPMIESFFRSFKLQDASFSSPIL